MQPWNKIAKMAPDAVKTMQDSLIAGMVKEMAVNHPYYSQKFKEINVNPDEIRQAGDMAKLPFTVKKDVAPTDDDKLRSKQFVLEKKEEVAKEEKKKGFFDKLFKKKDSEEDVDPYRLLQLFYTGARTGKMVPIVYTRYDIANLKEIAMRSFDMWGVGRDDSTINALGYAPHVSYWQMFYSTLHVGSTALQSGGGRVLGMEKILKALFNLEASVFITFPGYADFALQVLERFGFMMPSLEKVILGMDDAPMTLVERLKKNMAAVGAKNDQVFRCYFLSEAKGGWPECEPGFGYHINPDHCFVEIVDPETGEVKGEKEPGEIVVTNIDGRGTVFLRYRSGDFTTGGITYEPCENCGRTMPRILGDIERLGYYFDINTADGIKKFNFNKLRRALYGVNNLSQWYAEINAADGTDKVKLTVFGKKGVENDDLESSLKGVLKDDCPEIPVEIAFSSVEDITQRQGMEKNITDTRIFDKR